MRYLIIIIFFAAVILLILNIGGSKEDNPVSKGVSALGKAKTASLNAIMKNLMNALDSYYADHNEYPEILEILIPNYLRSENEIVDPWGTLIQLRKDEQLNLFLVSAGRDKAFGTEDDIKRSL
jgi:hypothetical protein